MKRLFFFLFLSRSWPILLLFYFQSNTPTAWCQECNAAIYAGRKTTLEDKRMPRKQRVAALSQDSGFPTGVSLEGTSKVKGGREWNSKAKHCLTCLHHSE